MIIIRGDRALVKWLKGGALNPLTKDSATLRTGGVMKTRPTDPPNVQANVLQMLLHYSSKRSKTSVLHPV